MDRTIHPSTTVLSMWATPRPWIVITIAIAALADLTQIIEFAR